MVSVIVRRGLQAVPHHWRREPLVNRPSRFKSRRALDVGRFASGVFSGARTTVSRIVSIIAAAVEFI